MYFGLRDILRELVACVILAPRERTLRLNMLRASVALIISVPLSLTYTLLLAPVLSSSHLSGADKGNGGLVGSAVRANYAPTDINQFRVDRGEFAQPVGRLPRNHISLLDEAIINAVPLQQYEIDVKEFKESLLRSRKVRILFILVEDSARSFIDVKRYIGLCEKSDVVCAVIDLRDEGGTSAQAEVLDEAIVAFSLLEKSAVVPFLRSLGFEKSKAAGTYVFDRSGRLLWFGAQKSSDSLFSVAEIVARTAELAQDPHASELPKHQGRELAARVPEGVSDRTPIRDGVKGPKPSSSTRSINIRELRGTVVAIETGAQTPLGESWVVKEARLRKKPILISFWGTWCIPCLKELPDLAKLNEKYGKDVFFVGLAQERNTLEARSLVRKTTEEHGLKIQYILPEGALARIVFGSEEDVPLPAFALFDKNGKMVYRFSGSIKNKETLSRLMQEIDQFTGASSSEN